MEGILDFAGSFGAVLIKLALEAIWAFGSIYIGAKVADRTKKAWKGWAAGIAAAILLGVLMGPAVDALTRTACSHADGYEACVEGD